MSLIPEGATRSFAKTMFKAKKNSPHLFFGLGIVGLIGSTVLACRATLKLEETLEEIKKDVDEINDKTIVHSEEVLVPEVVDRERVKELGIVTYKGAIELGKLYGPSIALGSVSVALLAGSHVQLTKRNAALTAAFTALTTAYDDYRARVRKEIGEERELEIYRAVETHEIRNENGKKELVKAVNPNGMSIYAKCFDASNPQWKNNSEFNRTFLQVQEQYANHRLHAYGFVFLNEVYELIGFERTSAGAITGWIKDSEEGDGYIDFGLFEARNSRFINAVEPNIWLDFNVDGVIWDKIP